MADKVLTKFNSNNHEYAVLHKVKLSGVTNGEAADVKDHANLSGEVDLSPIFPAVSAAVANRTLAVNSEGNGIVWSAGGNDEKVKINAATSANLPLILGRTVAPAVEAQEVARTTSAETGIYANGGKLHAMHLDAGDEADSKITIGGFTIEKDSNGILVIY